MTLRHVVVTLVTLSLSVGASAAGLHVDQNHPWTADINPGTVERPFKTISAAAHQVIATARSQGKMVAVPGRPADVALWANKGADVVFCTADITSLRSGLESAFQEARATQA